MRRQSLTLGLLLGAAAAAVTAVPAHDAPLPLSYTQVVELVVRAEAGDRTASDEGLARLGNDYETPLARAAWGRLMVLRSNSRPFTAMKYYDAYRGFAALNRYIKEHPADPQARVWRAASAVETSYVFWSPKLTRADITLALEGYRADPDLPNETVRCQMLLGTMAKDGGDLPTALKYWKAAFEADPTGPAGREAARMLALFTG